MSEQVEQVEAEEVLIGELQQEDGERTLYVYASPDDFLVTIPEGAKVTFGYFNPATPQANDYRFGNGPGGQTMKTTALRIYETGEKGNQLACFMGVHGFRDVDSVKKTIKTRIVTIQTNVEDDGRGNNSYKREQTATPLAITEEAAF